MGTPFSAIIDEAMVIINDYKLANIYKEDENLFAEILQSYMLRELPKFTECLKPLTYDLESQTFDSDFDINEIAIIADWTLIAWYEAQVNDVLEFKETLQNREFKKYSTGQNLKERYANLKMLRGRVKQDGTNYQFKNLDLISKGFKG